MGTERDAIPETVRLAAAYPNPATDRLSITVESSRAGTARVRIVDATGRTAESREMTVRAGTQDVQMDISDLAAGLYLLRIQVGSRIDSRSVVVIR